MTSESGQNLAYMISFIVVALIVTGFFIGLQSPMNPFESAIKGRVKNLRTFPETSSATIGLDGNVLAATGYFDIGEATRKRSVDWRTSLLDLKTNDDPMAEVEITPGQKKFALALREQNRAFNGAPPSVPHPIDQMSTQACMACHGQGIKTESLRVSKMSHHFLENCTQCHVENDPRHMPASLFRENSFVGLPAPTGGPRAFEGAPPMIPHSTWMRVDCMSCHGFAGVHGIRSTHPWRKNCQQCHAPSSELDQLEIGETPQFLPPPTISN